MFYAQTARRCLSSWITHSLTAIPIRSRATVVELLGEKGEKKGSAPLRYKIELAKNYLLTRLPGFT